MKASTHYTNNINPVKQSFFIADGEDFDPSTMAMMQAFYSRSTTSIATRTEGMNPEEVKKSLEKYYIGYGHRSIGQCGNFTIFLEDVSMFAAKVIQHHPLYNGQETSTRYYDFSSREMVLPFYVQGYEEYVRDLYTKILQNTHGVLEASSKFHGVHDAKMAGAVKARAFDIARAFLPAGFTTKLSWSTTFDQVQDHLEWMMNCPVAEVSDIAHKLFRMLREKYPQAIGDIESRVTSETRLQGSNNFFDNTDRMLSEMFPGHRRYAPGSKLPMEVSAEGMFLMDISRCSYDYRILKGRKKYEPVPKNFSKYGTQVFGFEIDYGSFRDLHRHRNGLVFFPRYSDVDGYRLHPWYMSQLETLGVLQMPGVEGHGTIKDSLEYLYTHMIPRVVETALAIHTKNSDSYHASLMYYIPMGTLVTAVMRYDLPQAVYVSELRSGQTVHPTARLAAQGMAQQVQFMFPGLQMYHDTTPDQGPVLRRAEQTIFEADKAIS